MTMLAPGPGKSMSAGEADRFRRDRAQGLWASLEDGELVGAPEVMVLAGCSYRMLDYWTREGLIVPVQEARGSGSRRLFDLHGVKQAMIVTRLSQLGFRPGLLVDLGIEEGLMFIAQEVADLVEAHL